MAAKKKPPVLPKKQQEEVNKKALIWVGSILIGIIVLMTVLLIINQS